MGVEEKLTWKEPLKPCPFCGGNSTTSIDALGMGYYIKCNICKSSAGVKENVDQATRLWQQRKWCDHSEDKPKELRLCPKCNGFASLKAVHDERDALVGWMIHCAYSSHCGMQMYSHAPRDELIQLWNSMPRNERDEEDESDRDE